MLTLRYDKKPNMQIFVVRSKTDRSLPHRTKQKIDERELIKHKKIREKAVQKFK